MQPFHHQNKNPSTNMLFSGAVPVAADIAEAVHP